MMAVRIILGIVFMICGILGVILTWLPYMQMPPISPPILGSIESWNMLTALTIEGIVTVIGIWLFVSGRNTNSSS